MCCTAHHTCELGAAGCLTANLAGFPVCFFLLLPCRERLEEEEEFAAATAAVTAALPAGTGPGLTAGPAPSAGGVTAGPAPSGPGLSGRTAVTGGAGRAAAAVSNRPAASGVAGRLAGWQACRHGGHLSNVAPSRPVAAPRQTSAVIWNSIALALCWQAHSHSSSLPVADENCRHVHHAKKSAYFVQTPHLKHTAVHARAHACRNTQQW